MSTKISQTRYMVLGSAVILAVLIAGCTAGPSGAPATPAGTTIATPAPISTAVPQTTLATTPAPISTTVPPTTQAITPVATVNQTPTPGQTVTISIRNLSLNPNNITIPVGTTVTWTNFDISPHQISSSPTSTEGPGKIFLSQVLEKNDTYSFTFNTTGSYQYFAVDYPPMLGTIIVKG